MENQDACPLKRDQTSDILRLPGSDSQATFYVCIRACSFKLQFVNFSILTNIYNCRVKTAYCYGLWTWIFGQTLWTEGIKFYDPHTSVDHTRNQRQPASSLAGHPRRRQLWAKYKSNNLRPPVTDKLWAIGGRRYLSVHGLSGSIKRPSLT